MVALDQAMDHADKQHPAGRPEEGRYRWTIRAGTTSTRSALLATILQLLKLPDGTVKVLVEAVSASSRRDPVPSAKVASRPNIELFAESPRSTTRRRIDVLMRSVISQFEQYVKLNKKIPPEILTSLAGIDQPGRLADTVAAHMAIEARGEAAGCLRWADVRTRLEHVHGLIEGEIDLLQHRKAYSWPGQAADGEEPARVLPE